LGKERKDNIALTSVRPDEKEVVDLEEGKKPTE